MVRQSEIENAELESQCQAEVAWEKQSREMLAEIVKQGEIQRIELCGQHEGYRHRKLEESIRLLIGMG